MLLVGSRLINVPVMGLQTGSELARTARAIINPRTLEVVAYEIQGPLLSMHPSLLRVADVREFSDLGLIVDSSDEFVAVEDIITLNEIYTLQFNPVGMKVIDEKRRRLGKVNGYTIETDGFLIQQLSIKRPFLRSLNDTELLVHRTQITEINDDVITIHNEAEVPKVQHPTQQRVYANPFRTIPQPEQISHKEQGAD